MGIFDLVMFLACFGLLIWYSHSAPTTPLTVRDGAMLALLTAVTVMSHRRSD